MPVFSPEMLAEWTGGAWKGPPAGRIAGFGIDSRILSPGQVFVAISTEVRDGHAFLEAARAGGASAALVSRYDPDLPLAQLVVRDTVQAFQTISREHRKGFSGAVIGITGSSGKTSTKELLALALGGDESVHATADNLNNTLGVPLTLLGIEPGIHRFAVIEAGISEPGEMEQLADLIRPDAVLVTTIGPSHLEALETLDNVAAEKARLLETLAPAGRVFLPQSCLRWEVLLRAATTVIAPEEADLPVSDRLIEDMVRFRANRSAAGRKLDVRFAEGRPVSTELSSTSHGMAFNAVLALAAAVHLGVDPERAAARISSWHPVSLRGEVMERSGQLVYLDCYNANPSSMLDAVQAFVDRVEDSVPRLYVIGGMEELGEASAEWHRKVGRAWPKSPVDRFAIVGADGPALREGLIAGGHESSMIELGETADQFRSLVESWGGALFIKGSRVHHLEKLLDSIRPTWRKEATVC